MTVSEYTLLPQDTKHYIYTFVSDQVQIKLVSKDFLDEFDLFKVLKEQYLRAGCPLLRSLTLRVVSLEGEAVDRVIVRNVYQTLIKDAKEVIPDINAMIGAELKQYGTLISPYGLEEIAERMKANDTIKVFRKIAGSVPQAHAFLGTLNQANPLEAASAIRTWMQNNQAHLAQVVNLDLSNLNLSSLPEEIGLLTHLETLHVQNNRLKQLVIPGTLTALRVLWANNNQLEQLVIPATLTALTHLDASNNQLAQFVIPGTLTALRILNVYNNQLAQFAIPGTLTALTRLYASNNILEQLVIPETLTALTHLWVNNNQLEQLVIPGTLTALRVLWANNNQLEQLVIPGTLAALTHLSASNNQLAAIPEFLAPHWIKGQEHGNVGNAACDFTGNPFCTPKKADDSKDESKKEEK